MNRASSWRERASSPHWLPVSVLVGGLAVTTAPFLVRLPINWDAAQLVLGVDRFSLADHQPHPPGYPLFVAIGKLLAPVADAECALLAMSCAAGCAAVLAMYALIHRIWGDRWLALFTSLAWMLDPVLWLYRTVALTYTFDALAVLLVVWLGWRPVGAPRRAPELIALVVVVAGGMRPSAVAMLLPLVALAWVRDGRVLRAVSAVAVLIVGCLAWYVPLVIVSGGWGAYRQISAELFDWAAGRTSVLFGAPWEATERQIAELGQVLLGTCGVMVVPAGWGIARLLRADDEERDPYPLVVAAAWVLPSLVVYGLVHFTRPGYALTIIPASYVLVAYGGHELLRDSPRWSVGVLAGAGAALLVAHSIPFLVMRPPGEARSGPGASARPNAMLSSVSNALPAIDQINAAFLAETESQIAAVANTARRHRPSEALVLTTRDLQMPNRRTSVGVGEPESMFRVLSAVLRDYLVVEVAPRRSLVLTSQHARLGRHRSRFFRVPAAVRFVLLAAPATTPDLLPAGITLRPRRPLWSSPVSVGPMIGSFRFLGVRFARASDG